MPFQHKKALQNYVPKQIPAENKKGYKTEYIYQTGMSGTANLKSSVSSGFVL